MQVAGLAAEELGRRGSDGVASLALPPDVQLHLGPYGGRHISGGGVVLHEVQTALCHHQHISSILGCHMCY